jgi:hypothetical protein
MYDHEAHYEAEVDAELQWVARLDEAAEAANLRPLIANLRAAAYARAREWGAVGHANATEALSGTLSMLLQVAGLEWSVARAIRAAVEGVLEEEKHINALHDAEALYAAARAEVRGSINHVPVADAAPF